MTLREDLARLIHDASFQARGYSEAAAADAILARYRLEEREPPRHAWPRTSTTHLTTGDNLTTRSPSGWTWEKEKEKEKERHDGM